VEVVEVVKSGDPVTGIPIAGLVFGGCLNGSGSGINCDLPFSPPGVGRTFRSIATSGDYIAFWAAMLSESTFETQGPFAPAEKIGLFRVELTDPITITALAIDGEPVNDYLGAPDSFLSGATWEIDLWTGATFDMAPQNEPRQGKSSGVAINRDGLCAFRARVKWTQPTERIIGAIFAHDGDPDDLIRLAVENTPTEAVPSTLVGVGNVVPRLDGLARPVINDQGFVAFYCWNTLNRTGVFYWDGEMQALLHQFQQDPPNDVFEIWEAPLLIIGGKAQGCESSGISGEHWYDQPDMNERGDVVFRARIEQDEFDTIIDTVWRWTRDTDTYDILFREGQDLPPKPCTSEPVEGVVAVPIYASEGEAFGRPAINRWGEVAVIAGAEYGSFFSFGAAILFYDCAGDSWTLARTEHPDFIIGITGEPVREIQDIGSGQTLGEPYRKELSLNDWGQVVCVMTMDEVGDPFVPSEWFILMRADYCPLFPISTAPPSERVLLGAGRGGDGDATLEERGTNLGGALVDSGTFRFDEPIETTGRFHAECAADVNWDNVVDTADLGLLLGQFGAQCPCSADVNQDGQVDTADLGLLLGAFGMNCRPCPGPGGSPESLMAEGRETMSGSVLLDMLGFKSVEDYVEYVDSLTASEREAHFAEVMEIIGGAR
jgi:hypothetical protein